MKSLFSILLLASASTLAQTSNKHVEQLKGLGFVEVDQSQIFVNEATSQTRESVAVDLSKAIPHLYQNYSENIGGGEVLALEDSIYEKKPCLKLFYKNYDGKIEIECWGYKGGGFGGSFGLSAVEQAGDLKKYEQLKKVSHETQLLKAGFVSQSPNIFVKTIDSSMQVVAILKQQKLKFLYKTAEAQFQQKMSSEVDFLKTTKKSEYGETLFSFSTNGLEYNFDYVFTDFEMQIVGYTKSLDQIPLAYFEAKLPKTYTDASGFQVGSMNTNDVIKSLKTLNGKSISAIEKDARQIQSCSNGTTFLGPTESLLEVMAHDNTTVLANNITHRDLALPLYYVRAIMYSGAPTDFMWKNHSYSIEFDDALPMCGGMESPFNDGVGTGLGYPVITNNDTGEQIEMTFIHPYFIAQYGFYGGNVGTRIITPEVLMRFFN